MGRLTLAQSHAKRIRRTTDSTTLRFFPREIDLASGQEAAAAEHARKGAIDSRGRCHATDGPSPMSEGGEAGMGISSPCSAGFPRRLRASSEFPPSVPPSFPHLLASPRRRHRRHRRHAQVRAFRVGASELPCLHCTYPPSPPAPSALHTP